MRHNLNLTRLISILFNGIRESQEFSTIEISSSVKPYNS